MGSWVAASTAAGDPSISEVLFSCAPALSTDESSLYILFSFHTAGPRSWTERRAMIDPTGHEVRWDPGEPPDPPPSSSEQRRVQQQTRQLEALPADRVGAYEIAKAVLALAEQVAIFNDNFAQWTPR
jgi:hypothetical protein